MFKKSFEFRSAHAGDIAKMLYGNVTVKMIVKIGGNIFKRFHILNGNLHFVYIFLSAIILKDK